MTTQLLIALASLVANAGSLIGPLSGPLPGRAPGPPIEDGAVFFDEVYAFPPFAEAPGYLPGETLGKYWDEQAYRAATEDERFELRKIRYQSTGLGVVAYVYAPRQPEQQPRPTVVFNRGGFVVGDQAPLFAPLFHFLARKGFAVVAPMLRESDGGEGKDKLGGDDLVDLMNVVPLIAALDFADADNLFLLGESRGGMMTFQAIRDGFPARAAATYGAFSDQGQLIETDDRYRQMAQWIWPDFATKPEPLVEVRSAVRWAERLTTPLLLLHGGQDGNIPPSHALELALALEQAELTYELHIYAEDGHLLLRNKVDSLDRIAAWFERHRGG